MPGCRGGTCSLNGFASMPPRSYRSGCTCGYSALIRQRDTTTPRQSPSNGAFLLKENLKTFTHTFRVNERLELEACPNPLRFGLPFVIEIGELIFLPKREQKRGLRSEANSFKARSFSPHFESGEIDVRGQVLLTG